MHRFRPPCADHSPACFRSTSSATASTLTAAKPKPEQTTTAALSLHKRRTKNPGGGNPSSSSFWIVVPKEGIEPSHPRGYRILSPARLPIPPLRRCRSTSPSSARTVNGSLLPAQPRMRRDGVPPRCRRGCAERHPFAPAGPGSATTHRRRHCGLRSPRTTRSERRCRRS